MGKGQSKSFDPDTTLKDPWRKLTWSEEKTQIMKELEDFKPNSESNSVIRILVYGPVGAGKSCFINSVQRVLLGRNNSGALEQAAHMGKSFTRAIRTHKLKKRGGGRYPIALTDITGLHAEDGGIQSDDIIKVLEGHISDGYNFHPEQTISENSQHYRPNPGLQDKVHCLVNIIPADAVSRMDNKVIEKMRTVRLKARDLNIPQVIVLTKVDQACLMVSQNLKKIYHSKKIKEKVDESHNKLGIPLNKIYPVKNYHAEITQNEDNDVLILMALRDIVNFANDFLEDQEDQEGGRVDY